MKEFRAIAIVTAMITLSWRANGADTVFKLLHTHEALTGARLDDRITTVTVAMERTWRIKTIIFDVVYLKARCTREEALEISKNSNADQRASRTLERVP